MNTTFYSFRSGTDRLDVMKLKAYRAASLKAPQPSYWKSRYTDLTWAVSRRRNYVDLHS